MNETQHAYEKHSEFLNRKRVHAALKVLHQGEQLSQQPLTGLTAVTAQRVKMGHPPTKIGNGLALRALLLDAIEALKPTSGAVTDKEKGVRAYTIAVERYLKGRSVSAIEEMLGLARSTYNHEHAAMLDRLVFILEEWELNATATPVPVANEHPRTEVALRMDWGAMRDSSHFCGRQQDLQQLTHWISQDRCRLIGVVGFGGVGKTALLEKLVRQLAHQFDYVIWRSVINAPPLTEILREFIRFLTHEQPMQWPQDPEDQITLLINCLQTQHCLLVLDNFETLLQESEVSGRYRPGYEGYGRLLKRLGEQEHQSCLLLTSREKPPETVLLAGKNAPVRIYALSGLNTVDAQAMLSEQGLYGTPEAWQTLIAHYVGNPLALRLVTATIAELCRSDIQTFLDQNVTVFGEIRKLMEAQFNRLSTLEQSILYWLAIARADTSVGEIKESLLDTPPQAQLLEALQSLQRRSFVEQAPNGFGLQNMVMEYVTERYLDELYHELTTSHIRRFNTHALLKAQTKSFIRQSQVRMIVGPLAERLCATQPHINAVTFLLRQTLTRLQEENRHQRGYAAGNLLNLLGYLKVDLSGYSFAGSAIWQAYLVDINLRNVDFSNANFKASLFTHRFGVVSTVAFSGDGSLLAAGAATADILFWRTADGMPHLVCQGHTDWVLTIAFSHQGSLLASGSEDQRVRVWDVEKGQMMHTFIGHGGRVRSVTFSPDDTLLASAGDDATVRLWSMQRNQQVLMLSGHTAVVRCVAFSPNGRLLATGSDDQTIRLWKVANGACLAVLQGHEHNVNALSFTPDSQWLVSGSRDQTIRRWHIATGKFVQTLAYKAVISSISLSADGCTLVSGNNDHTVLLWEIATGKIMKTILGHRDNVRAVAFGPGGSTVCSGSDDQTVRLWDVATGQCLHTFQGYVNWIAALAVNPGGSLLASVGHDTFIRLWDLSTATCVTTLYGHDARVMAVTFSPDGLLLGSVSNDQTLRLWDVKRAHCLQVLQGHRDHIRALAFSPDGKSIATGSDDEQIKLWDVQTGHCWRTLRGHTGQVRGVVFHPTEKLVFSGSYDHTVKLWDSQTGECLQTCRGHHDWVRAVAVSDSGSTVVSASDDKTIRVWDIATGQCLITLHGHTDRVPALCFGRTDHELISGSEDQTIKIWNIHTAECVATLRGHTHRVTTIAFDSRSSRLISGDDDGVIICWDLEKGTPAKTLRPDRPYEKMKITGATGLTDAQKASLQALGACESP